MVMTSTLFDWTPRCSTRGGAAAIPSDSYAGELPVAVSNEDNQALSFKPAQAANADDDRKGTNTWYMVARASTAAKQHGSAEREVAPIEAP